MFSIPIPFMGSQKKEEKVVPAPKVLKNVTVKQIHNEFDSAVDKLINEAINIKSSDKEKHDTLKSLGFLQSAHVAKTSVIVDKINENKRISDFVNHYRQNYPFNKFITNQLALDICKKYGLVLGKVYNFIGDVPDENVAEISSFKIKEEDYIQVKNSWFMMKDDRYPESCLIGTSGAVLGRFYNEDSYVKPTAAIRWFGGNSGFVFATEEVEKFCPALKICAPVKDFNMANKKVENFTVVADIKDPIVLHPVPGGYLIVSKWGEEASDKSLVNEIDN